MQFPAEIGTIDLPVDRNPTIKTLIIRFSSVGDIVLSSPLIRALRHRFPDMQMDFLVKDAYADLVRWNPHVTRVIAFPQGGAFQDLVRLRRRIRAERYDVILDIHDSLRSRFLCAGARSVRRVNKRKIARFALIHFKVNLYGLFRGAPGVAERYLETASGLGVAGDGGGPELFLPAAAVERAQELLAAEGLEGETALLGICPSARHFTKMWPEERFAEAAAAFAVRRNASVVLFGADDEAERCRSIARVIARRSPGTRTAVLAGHSSLLVSAAVMDRCGVVVTNDTGLMHCATARERPVVAVFGSTVRQFGFFPMGPASRVVEHPSLACRPCTHIGREQCPLGHFHCMTEIAPEAVVDAASSVWEAASPAAAVTRRSS